VSLKVPTFESYVQILVLCFTRHKTSSKISLLKYTVKYGLSRYQVGARRNFLRFL